MTKPQKINPRTHWNKRLFGTATQKGLDHDDLRRLAVVHFGIDRIRDLDADQLKLFCEKLEGRKLRRHVPESPAAVGSVTDKQLYFIRKNRAAAGLADDASFNFWLADKMHIFKNAAEIERLTRLEGIKIIEAIKSMKPRYKRGSG